MIFELQRNKSKLIFAHDTIIILFSWYFSFALRFNFQLSYEFSETLNNTILITLLIQTIFFYLFGLYKASWRFISTYELKQILKASFISTLLLFFIFYILFKIPVPRSIYIINFVILIFFQGGSRFLYRFIYEYKLKNENLGEIKKVLFYGTGQPAISLFKELSLFKKFNIIGFLDNNPSMHGREINGKKVLGDISSLKKIISTHKSFLLIIATPTIQPHESRKIINIASKFDIDILTIPSFEDLLSGKLNISQIRKVDVEDLLGRDLVELDTKDSFYLINNKSVMVSGSGGSIGSELCKQIIKLNPSLLLCLDFSEFLLYKLEQELLKFDFKGKLVFVIADIKNSTRLDEIFKKYNPSVVFHAAAYKHVPLMENNNVIEAINNNVLGTYNLAKISKKYGVYKFIQVSTDKAVNPTNVMGATKRLAEMLCQGLQDKNKTSFIIVRFGNVLGSSGSVIPKFRDQISHGGPITLTHLEITRYFMSIPEAAQLVIQAGFMGNGGEIYVLDMGKPIKIRDLAKDMIRLSGFQDDEIKIKVTGLRPGEKLYEEPLADYEKTLATPNNKIRIASAEKVNFAWVESLILWISTIRKKDEKVIKSELNKWLKKN